MALAFGDFHPGLDLVFNSFLVQTLNIARADANLQENV